MTKWQSYWFTSNRCSATAVYSTPTAPYISLQIVSILSFKESPNGYRNLKHTHQSSSIKSVIRHNNIASMITHSSIDYVKGDPSLLDALQASITAWPKSVAPAPPSAQWFATTALNAPASRDRSRTKFNSASVSVENLLVHYEVYHIQYTITIIVDQYMWFTNRLIATTAFTPNFLMFLMWWIRFAQPA